MRVIVVGPKAEHPEGSRHYPEVMRDEAGEVILAESGHPRQTGRLVIEEPDGTIVTYEAGTWHWAGTVSP